MADSPSPVPESELNTFAKAMPVVQAGFDRWKSKPHNAKWVRLIDGTPLPNDLCVNIAEAVAESAEASAREAWAELSKERLERRIVEETAKRDRWHMERFKASARSARADALEEREALGSARIRIAALETLVLSCCDHEFMDDADEMLFEDILERRSGRSLKTAPKGDGEGK